MMLPSKKITIGICLITASLISRVLVGLIAWQMIGSISDVMNHSGTLPEAKGDLNVIQGHSLVLNTAVAGSVVLTIAGFIFVMIGVFQNARATESLMRPLNDQNRK